MGLYVWRCFRRALSLVHERKRWMSGILAQMRPHGTFWRQTTITGNSRSSWMTDVHRRIAVWMTWRRRLFLVLLNIVILSVGQWISHHCEQWVRVYFVLLQGCPRESRVVTCWDLSPSHYPKFTTLAICRWHLKTFLFHFSYPDIVIWLAPSFIVF